MTMRRLLWLLMPLLLVLAQQGQLRHEYSEHSTPVQSQKKAPDGDRCGLCFSFAQVAGVASSGSAATALLGGLAFHPTLAPRFVVTDIGRPAPRSRGPPLSS